MKKILILCIFVLMSTHANASTLCAADNTIPIVLNPEINATTGNYSAVPGEFSVTFPYGTLYGIGTCVSTKPSSGSDVRKTLVDTTTGKVVTKYEELGQYCWCQITHPFKSLWVPFADKYSLNSCVEYCTFNCYYSTTNTYNAGLNSNSASRKRVFSTIGK